MRRVTGISRAAFRWSEDHAGGNNGTTVWSPFAADTAYFSPGTASFMINYRVPDLHALLSVLREEGCDNEPWPAGRGSRGIRAAGTRDARLRRAACGSCVAS